MRSKTIATGVLALLTLTIHPVRTNAQHWASPARAAEQASKRPTSKTALGFEFRTPIAGQTEVSSGKDLNLRADLLRTHVGMTSAPVKHSASPGSLEDSRAQRNSQIPSNSFHDSSDLQEIHNGFRNLVRASYAVPRARLAF